MHDFENYAPSALGLHTASKDVTYPPVYVDAGTTALSAGPDSQVMDFNYRRLPLLGACENTTPVPPDKTDILYRQRLG